MVAHTGKDIAHAYSYRWKHGALCGIRLFHHKTRHKKFYLGVPILLVIQIVLLSLFLIDMKLLIHQK